MYKFQIVKKSETEFHVRFMYNNEIIFATESYTRKEAALNAIRSIKENSSEAIIEEVVSE